MSKLSVLTGARQVAPHCRLPPSQQNQQIWNHLLRMYADVRRLPPEMLSLLLQPTLPPFSSSSVLATSSLASPSGGRSGPTGTSFDLATSVRYSIWYNFVIGPAMLKDTFLLKVLRQPWTLSVLGLLFRQQLTTEVPGKVILNTEKMWETFGGPGSVPDPSGGAHNALQTPQLTEIGSTAVSQELHPRCRSFGPG